MPPTYANGHISATGDPIHFMFGSRVGFSGTADLMALSSILINSRWRPPPSWKNFEWPYLRNGSRYTYIARIARSSRGHLCDSTAFLFNFKCLSTVAQILQCCVCRLSVCNVSIVANCGYCVLQHNVLFTPYRKS